MYRVRHYTPLPSGKGFGVTPILAQPDLDKLNKLTGGIDAIIKGHTPVIGCIGANLNRLLHARLPVRLGKGHRHATDHQSRTGL